MVGILVEKFSAKQNFVKALGGSTGVYNGEQYIITSASGHLYAFVDPSQQVSASLEQKYKKWDLKNLPWNEKEFQWKKKPTNTDLIKTIHSDLSSCDEIVIATDDDPTGEGELLAWEILEHIDLHGKKISRMYFVDERPQSVQKAFVERRPIYSKETDMDYVKADYRSKWDFLSMQFSRIATMCGDGKSVLRQGRLKSAMVLLTGQALDAVNNYKKIPFYKNKFKDENGNTYSSNKEPMFPTKAEVPQTYESSDVIIDSRTTKYTAPPALMDLTELSAILSSKGVKAKEVLDTYQKMYEDHVVSYPRTEDKKVTPGQFEELLPYIDKIATVVGIDPTILTHREPRPTHVAIGGTHGANRPDVNVPDNLEDLKQYGKSAPLIYEILAKNYLASLAEDYEYISETGHLSKYPDFKGSTKIPQKQGYRAVFYDKDDDDKGATNKQLGKTANPFIFEGYPPKPPVPTMKWLVKQLKKYDVGTGATRTSVYADLTSTKHKYPLLVDKKGKLSMTQYGNMSYLLLKDTHIGNLKTTENLMSEMRDIAAGKINANECLAKMQKMVIDDLQTMKNNGITMRKELKIMEQNQEKEKYTGIWNGEEVSFSKTWSSHTFTDDECRRLCNGEEIEITGLKSNKGTTYGVKGKLSRQTYNNKEFVGFERTAFLENNDSADERVKGVWNGQEVSFKRVWSGHRFTDDEVTALLNGEEIELHELKGSKGTTYDVKGKLAEQTYNGHSFIGFNRTGFLDNNKTDDDRASGVWKGKEVSFKRIWGGHRFTDDEVTALLNGEEIELRDLKGKKGTYSVKGKLAEQTYKGHKFVGFDKTDFI